MHDPFPSCFTGGAATPPAATAEGPRVTTSVYETRLGLAALTWSRTALGISLRVDLRLPSFSDAASSVSSGDSAEDEDGGCFRFRIRPWLLWKRRGSKRFHPKEQQEHGQLHHPVVDFAWNLSRARFHPGRGPEPSAQFFLAVAVDGEMLLVVGDMEAEAYKKTKTSRNSTVPTYPPTMGSPSNANLVSRREHVVLPRYGRPYTTRATFAGKERKITIALRGAGGGKEAKLSVEVDGERVLQVKQLKWKFRGNEEVEVGGGARVQVSWDVHSWLFKREPDPLPPADASTSASGHAVLLFRFDREEEEEEDDVKAHIDTHSSSNDVYGVGHGSGLLGLYRVRELCNGDLNSRSISGGGLGSKTVGKKSSLMKTMSSSSSSSSASSGSRSSVMEWASAEESELPGSDGFSLLVSVWKG